MQNAYPTGDTFNHVVLADGMIYTWSNNTWVNTQVVASGTSLPNNSVTLTKTVMFLPTKNLLDIYQLENGYTDFTNCTFKTHASYKVTPFISVTAGLTYLTNKATSGYVFYDTNKTFISAVENTTANQVLTAPENSVYMRVSFSGSTTFGDAQIEQGNVPTSYTKPHRLDTSYIKNLTGSSIDDKSVSMKKVDFSIQSSKNFFNYLTDIDNGITYVFPTDGRLSTSSSYGFKVTKLIKVDSETSYVSNGRIRSVAFYNAMGVR